MQDKHNGPGLCECGCGQQTRPAPCSDKRIGWVRGQPIRFVNGHNARRLSPTKRYAIEDRGYSTPCWIWQGAITGRGYGSASVTRNGRIKSVSAHRTIYVELRGAIPEGLQLDHLCRVRACVNPDHLEPVTGRENTLRGQTLAAANRAKTHCPQGHPYAGDNLFVNSHGSRRCKTCRRAAKERYKEKNR